MKFSQLGKKIEKNATRAREKERKRRGEGGRQGSRLREIPFESIPTHFGPHVCTKRSGSEAATRVTNARADAISSRGSQKFRASHFYAARTPPRSPSPQSRPSPRFISCRFIFFRRQYVDLHVSRRTTVARASTTTSASRVVYSAYTQHVHTCTRVHICTRTRTRAFTWDWPCLDNAITSLNFLSLCLTSVTGGPPR